MLHLGGDVIVTAAWRLHAAVTITTRAADVQGEHKVFP
jgi:hypothetical protein